MIDVETEIQESIEDFDYDSDEPTFESMYEDRSEEGFDKEEWIEKGRK